MKKSLEFRIAEQLVKIGVKNLSEAQMHKLQHRVLQLMEADTPTAPKPVNFIFTFDLGKYKANELTQAQINQLAADMKPIINNIGGSTTLINIKTAVALNAEADPTPINQSGNLYKAGIKTNEQLAAARLATLEQVIRAIIISQLPGATNDIIDSFVTFTKTTKTGATRNITANITQTGDTPKDPFKCDFSAEKTGVQANASNSYVGYEYDHPITVPAGTQITLKFDPRTIPDCFFLKYGDSFAYSGFTGNLPAKINSFYAEGELPQWIVDKDVTFEQYARYIVFKENGGAVDKAIQAYVAKSKGNATTEVVAAETGELSYTFTKAAFKDTIKLIVFSPLGNTVFDVSMTCKLPDPAALKPLPTPESFK